MSKIWELTQKTLSLLRKQDAWLGSFYELDIAYHARSLTQQDQIDIVQWLWDDPSLQGVVKHRDQFGQAWQTIDHSFLPRAQHAYGCIRFPNGKIVGCGSLHASTNEMDWFTLYIPFGMLDRVFRIQYPVTREKNPWIPQIDEFLAAIGTRIYQRYPFFFAIMGEEAASMPIKTILAHMAHDPGLLVPETTFRQVRVAPYGKQVSAGLWWTGGRESLSPP